jgi:hypothetical protein
MWLTARSREDHLIFMREISTVCSAKGGPLAAKLNTLLQEGKFRDIVEYKFDYEDGHDYSDYCYARQIVALVEKQGFLDLGYDRKGEAVKAFLAAEEKCRLTNIRLETHCPEGDVAAVMYYAQRKISEVLGECPSIESLDFFFGPGASTNVKGAIASFRTKLSARMACSEDMIPILPSFLAELGAWTSTVGVKDPHDEDLLHVPVDIHIGKVHFVPKNSKTDRPICVEPVLNSLLQKGVGSYIKGRLRRFGVNLFDQRRNQELARVGSEKGNLCTIDLKSASDTVALGLVINLLPLEWVDLLGSCRTGTVDCEGTSLVLEKFSSMGNGFTFELESLIFFGLMSGVVSYMRQMGEIGKHEYAPIGVYGDDLIIPTQGYNLAERVLTYCGFETNTRKSFFTGPFRESCGADYFLGLDLRPFYLRKEISDQVLYSFHNWAIRHAEPEMAMVCLRWTKRRLRIWGPDGYGDGHLVGSYFLMVPREVRRSGWDGGFFHSYQCRPKEFVKPLVNDALIPSYVAYAMGGGEEPVNPFVIRGASGYVRRRLYTNSRRIFSREQRTG